jgi:diguanylate cyclase (GGDEF)-like protein
MVDAIILLQAQALTIVLAIAAFAGGLYLHLAKKRATRQAQHAYVAMNKATQEMAALRAALDHIDYGIALLDRDLRAQFLNRTFRTMWRIPDEKAERKPTFVDLMYHGRDIKAYEIAPDQLEAFVEKRLALVRAGNETPVDLRLVEGQVIRFQCKVIPDDGRMLTYVDVSDLVRSADEFKELATTDGLTELFNRRHFLKLADEAWERLERYSSPLSLLMIDIDNFKSINDRYGHDVGDLVIARVADVCREGKRAPDVAARLGGEEFALLLPETDLQDASLAAERLRKMVAEHPIITASGTVSATVSIGIAQASSDTPTIAELLKQADRALYQAKRSGRNRVMTASAINPSDSTHRPLLLAG